MSSNARSFSPPGTKAPGPAQLVEMVSLGRSRRPRPRRTRTRIWLSRNLVGLTVSRTPFSKRTKLVPRSAAAVCSATFPGAPKFVYGHFRAASALGAATGVALDAA